MALQIVRALLDDLHSNDISYCHWKSNEHVEAAMNGDTDLDILFDPSQEDKVVEILKRNKFHLFEAVWYRKYKGIFDYIGFDKAQGKIVHVHTHFHLDIGEVGIKSYRMPWERMILENKVFNERLKIFTSSAETELLLLIVRTAFKHDVLDTQSNHSISRHFKVEAAWLYGQVDTKKLVVLSEQVLGGEMTGLVEQICLGKNYDEKLFVALKKHLKPYFAEHRILSTQRVNYLKLVHFVYRVRIKLRKLFRISTRTPKRSLPQKGVVLCLMGSDGAGKSTQTKSLTAELSKKVDVLFMYMGSGDGAKSLQRQIVERCIQLGARLGASKKSKTKTSFQQEENNSKNDISRFSFPKQFLLSIKAASLAFEKKNRLKRIQKERNRGCIVICDRYPQTTTLGYNDGPKLYCNITSTNIILKFLAQYEFNCYELAKKIYPDIVIKLTGSVDVLHTRRPEMTKEEISKKQDGIIKLQFDPPTEVLNIDIDQPVCEIRGRIMDELSHQITVISGAVVGPSLY
ncbi:MAG TPA: hypothetical protein PKV73_07795 [Agriterribacter sp.]|nr:hypothetical protein [Chitinophagaceae bacterium]HRP31777.1 hypothetical protein [Agriterribacter sp.]